MTDVASTARGTIRAIDRVLRPVELAAAILAAAMMLSAMVLVSADSVGRYVFNAPLSFQFYLTENYLLVGLITLPLAWGFRTGGYIRIMAAADRLRGAARSGLLRVGLLASSAYVAALAWTAGGYFLEAYTTHAFDIGTIDWPVSWSWVWIPAGCGLLALRLLLTALGPLEQLHVEHDPAEDAV